MAPGMFRIASIIVLLQATTALASVESDNADAPEPARPPVAKPELPPDPYGRSPLRLDAELGMAFGEVSAFAMRAHVGYSRWWVSSQDLTGDSHWHAGLRFSAGAALGAEFGSNAYGTLAPYGELGLVFVKERDDRDDPKHVLLFTRVEPRLFGGELGERGARVGVGFTLDGFDAVGLGLGQGDKDEVRDFTMIALLPAALAMLAVVNARDVELATDVGANGKHEYAVMLGFGM